MHYLTVSLKHVHKKKDFSCEVELLDNYLHRQAKQDVKRKLTACFVLANENNTIKGYYTLSSLSIAQSELPEAIAKKLPNSYQDLPVTLMGRLAVDRHFKGQKLGQLLLLDALKRSFDVSKSIGSMAVIVDPINENAVRFYQKYGFILLDSGKMFLPMKTIGQLF